MKGFFSPSTWNAPVEAGDKMALCGQCGLHKQCYSPCMAPTGKNKTGVLFVAEAPGEHEDKIGEQLIGDAGQLLRRILEDIKEDLDDSVKTNCVICRPPKNKIESVHIESCRPNLLKTIAEIKPKVIVLLGGSPVESLISTEWKKDIGGIGKWAGLTIPSHNYNAWICPTYHPSFALRMNEDPALVLLIKQHIKKAFELVDVPLPENPLEDFKKQVEIVTNPRLARNVLRELIGNAEAEENPNQDCIAFDYETTGLKPDRKEQQIISCSICFEGKQTWAFMVDESILKLLSSILSNPNIAKVASNIKFEERWTLAKMGHGVKGWHWDTMLASHVIDNRAGICLIKFQSYIYFGISDYDSHTSQYLSAENSNGLNNIKSCDQNELLLYNGLDSLLEFKIMEKQKEIMQWKR